MSIAEKSALSVVKKYLQRHPIDLSLPADDFYTEMRPEIDAIYRSASDADSLLDFFVVLDAFVRNLDVVILNKERYGI